MTKKGSKPNEQTQGNEGETSKAPETSKVKTGAAKMTFEKWGQHLRMVGSQVGASMRLDIDRNELLTESEAKGYIEKYRGGSPDGK